jgi:hypothetical protein
MSEGEFGYYFETYGPFPIPLSNGKIPRPPAKWWETVIDYIYDDGDLSRAIGCYMFAMGDAHIRPRYIGKTVNQKGFREEVFTSHKRKHYNWVVSEGFRGPPVLYLFPLVTRRSKKNGDLPRVLATTTRLSGLSGR